MLECLDNVVVLSNTCEGEVGVFSINSLGITEEFLSSINGKGETPQSLFVSIREWAKSYLQNSVITAQQKTIIAKTMVDRARIGVPLDTNDLVSAPAGTVGGLVLDLNNPSTNTVLRLGNVGFYGNATGTTTFTIYDLLDGSVVTTFTLDLVAGESVRKDVQITLPAYRERKRYFIAHPLPEYETLHITPGGCNGCGEGGFKFGGMYAYGAQIASALPKRYGNIQRVGHTSGLSIVATLECDHNQWICENANVMALPLAYLVGRGVMDAALAQTERLNNAQTEQRRKQFLERAKQYDFEFKRALENATANMVVPNEPLCFQCRPVTQLRVGIP